MDQDRQQELEKVSAELAAARLAYKKQLRITMISCVVALAVIGAATYAWFVSIRKTEAEGMYTEVAVSSNMIISKTSEEILAADPSVTTDTVEFTDVVKDLIPARHKADSDTLLEYNSNPRMVDSDKGLSRDADEELTFADVPVFEDGDPRRYYYDFTVYTASTAESFEAQSLTAELTLTPADTLKDYMQAVTIDFYVNGEYKDTLNAAGKDWRNNGTVKTIVELGGDDGITVPLNTEDYITITMRCYFDGGLEKTEGQTYVYSNGLSNADYDLTVTFTATDKV